jgi:beta-1,2-mannosyltransferase
MISRIKRSKKVFLRFIVFVIVILILVYSAGSKDSLLRDIEQVYLGYDNRFDRLPKMIVFPENYVASNSSSLEQDYLIITGRKKIPMNSSVIQYNNQNQYANSGFDRYDNETDFTGYNLTLFDTKVNIGGGNDDRKCKKIENQIQINVSKSKSLDFELKDIIRTHFNFQNSYLQELRGFFGSSWSVQNEVNHHDFKRKWFKLAGSSIWLERYGVHFMISRITYCPTKAKNDPLFSLSYAQIFDKSWNELKNIELVLPTNEAVMNSSLTSTIFPTFLNLPFYFDTFKKGNYGHEDPRLILTVNENGYEEPMMVTNAYNKHIKHYAGTKADKEFAYSRSMFLCYPWQFQIGKRNVDISCENLGLYNKIVELLPENNLDSEIQKNWTPFFNYEKRLKDNYDKEVFFVYRWQNLEIYRCSLEDIEDGAIICRFEYQMDSNLLPDAPVGDLRGGTELINVNEFIDKFTGKFDQLELIVNRIPKNRQIWLGFARAHLKDCGCTTHMYRPNLVVMTADSNGVGGTSKYKISTISSFMALNIQMKGWHTLDNFCGTISALIPNGISDWVFEGKHSDLYESTKSLDMIVDKLMLSYSISDDTVEIIQIENLLMEMLKLDSKNPHYKLFEKGTFSKGYNNDNVECAIRESYQFCADFAENVKNRKPSFYI